MKVEFKKSFAKDLKALKDQELLDRVRELIELVENAAVLSEIPGLKKLKGGGNYFRLRIGDYRVGIALEDDTVIFVRILNRKDIYKHFP
ncbi:MAG: type II toxin-antitoxin system RelE/ParE family toxin [Pirellulales bacterium]